MPDNFEKSVLLEFPATLEYELDVDDEGVLNLGCTIHTDDYISQNFNLPFYSLTDSIVEFHKGARDYNQLYSIANELTKESERIREVADQIESSVANVADLFNTAYVPPT